MSKVYFAYGSNMSSAWLIRRTPSAKALGLARVADKKLVFNKISINSSGKANIVDAPMEAVWGVLFEIDENDIPNLDNAEKGYDRQSIAVTDLEGHQIQAFTYVSTQTNDELIPYDWYLSLVIEGAGEYNLPKSYQEKLRSFPTKPDPKKAK
jgi:gamma-glutamylcyclotransferase